MIGPVGAKCWLGPAQAVLCPQNKTLFYQLCDGRFFFITFGVNLCPSKRIGKDFRKFSKLKGIKQVLRMT